MSVYALLRSDAFLETVHALENGSENAWVMSVELPLARTLVVLRLEQPPPGSLPPFVSVVGPEVAQTCKMNQVSMNESRRTTISSTI